MFRMAHWHTWGLCEHVWKVGPPSLCSVMASLPLSGLSMWLMSPSGLNQGNQILYMTIPGSQKHKSRSCQTFLRFRPGTGIASLLCIILTLVSYRPSPDLVWEGTIQEYEFWEEMCMGGTFGELATTVCYIARVDHQVSWPGAYTFSHQVYGSQE